MAAGDSYAGIAVPEGDPEQLRGLGRSYSGLAGAVDSAATVFDALPNELSMWQGPASVAFAGASVMGGGGARSAGSVLDGNAATLRVYADDLDDTQRKAERAIEDARDAARRMREAEKMIDDARDRQAEANQRAAGAELVLVATGAVGIDFGGAEAAKAQAERDAAEAAGDERRARRLLEQAIEDLEAAKRRGNDAEDEARTAALRAAGALGAGTPGGIPGALGGPAGPSRGGGGLPLAALLPIALLGGGSGEKVFGELAPMLGFTDGIGGSTFGDREDRRIANDDRMRIPSGDGPTARAAPAGTSRVTGRGASCLSAT